MFRKNNLAPIYLFIALSAISSSSVISSLIMKWCISAQISIAKITLSYLIRKILILSLSVPIGYLADKINFKNIIITNCIICITRTLMIIKQPDLIYLYIIIGGAISSFNQGKTGSKLYQLLDKKKSTNSYQKIISQFFIISNLINSAMIFLGFYVYDNYGYQAIAITQLTLELLKTAMNLKFQNRKLLTADRFNLNKKYNDVLFLFKQNTNNFVNMAFIGIITFMAIPATKIMKLVLIENEAPQKIISSFQSLRIMLMGAGSFITYLTSINLRFKTRVYTVIFMNLLIIISIQNFNMNQINIGPYSVALFTLPMLLYSLMFSLIEIPSMKICMEQQANKLVHASISIAFMFNTILDLSYLSFSSIMSKFSVSHQSFFQLYTLILSVILLLLLQIKGKNKIY